MSKDPYDPIKTKEQIDQELLGNQRSQVERDRTMINQSANHHNYDERGYCQNPSCDWNGWNARSDPPCPVNFGGKKAGTVQEQERMLAELNGKVVSEAESELNDIVNDALSETFCPDCEHPRCKNKIKLYKSAIKSLFAAHLDAIAEKLKTLYQDEHPTDSETGEPVETYGYETTHNQALDQCRTIIKEEARRLRSFRN